MSGGKSLMKNSEGLRFFDKLRMTWGEGLAMTGKKSAMTEKKRQCQKKFI